MRLLGEALTFDDVLLLPQFSQVLPGEVSVGTVLCQKTRPINLQIPILSAAMDTVTESAMAIAMAQEGGIGIVHKNMGVAEQAQQIALVKAEEKGSLLVGAAVGVGADLMERATALVAEGVDVLVLDSAHGHSKGIIESLKLLKKQFPKTPIIAGNIATAKGAVALVEAGADGVKVGVGPGSICTTRIVSGVGVPQITAIREVSEALADSQVTIIADGGIRYSGDIVKALAAGAHMVMLGGLLAGTDESPSTMQHSEHGVFKQYRGMGSLGAMAAANNSRDRYFQEKGAQTGKLVPEGVEGRVPYQGPLKRVLHQLVGGLRSGMGYNGAASLESLRNNAEMVRISAAGMRESHAHGVSIDVEPPNYRAP